MNNKRNKKNYRYKKTSSKYSIIITLALLLVFGLISTTFAMYVSNTDNNTDKQSVAVSIRNNARKDIADVGANIDVADTGITMNGGTIYFDNSSLKWSDVQLFIGHDGYTAVYPLTKITNTNLYYKTMSSWSGATYMRFVTGCSSWTAGKWGPSNTPSGDKATGTYTGSYTFNVNSYCIFVPGSGSSYPSISPTYLSAYTVNNYNVTATPALSGTASTDGGSTTVAGYYLSAYNTASTRSATATTTKLARTSTATLKATAKTGYAFDGWYSTLGGTKLSSSTTYTFTVGGSDTTYYANFVPDTKYTVSATAQYTVDGTNYTTGTSGGNTTVTDSLVSSGTNVTFTATPESDYVFDGWYSGSTKVSSNNPYTKSITSDTSLVAKFIKQYTLTFKDSDGTTIDSDTVSAGGSATAPDVTAPSGKVFDGWYTQQSGGSKVTTFTNITSDATYYARYSMSNDLVEILNGEKIMFYGGEPVSWNQTQFNVYKDDDSALATGTMDSTNRKVTYNRDYMFAPITAPADDYYMGHWKNSLHTTASAGCSYIVTNSFDNCEQYSLVYVMSSGSDALYYTGSSLYTSTATTNISDNNPVQGDQITFSTTSQAGNSSIGKTNTFIYYWYDGSNWNEIAAGSSIDTSTLDYDESYKLVTLLYDGNIYVKADEDTFTVTNPTKYNWTANVNSSSYGSVTPNSGWVYAGRSVSLSVTPNDGYEIKNVTPTNGTVSIAGNNITFTPTADNAVCNIELGLIEYQITIVSYYRDGSASYSSKISTSTKTLSYGNRTITATDYSAEGKDFDGWTEGYNVTPSSFISTNQSMTISVTGNKTYYAYYTQRVTAGQIQGSTSVALNKNATFNTNASHGNGTYTYVFKVDGVVRQTYNNVSLKVKPWTVLGQNIGDVGSHTITYDVTSNGKTVTSASYNVKVVPSKPTITSFEYSQANEYTAGAEAILPSVTSDCVNQAVYTYSMVTPQDGASTSEYSINTSTGAFTATKPGTYIIGVSVIDKKMVDGVEYKSSPSDIVNTTVYVKPMKPTLTLEYPTYYQSAPSVLPTADTGYQTPYTLDETAVESFACISSNSPNCNINPTTGEFSSDVAGTYTISYTVSIKVNGQVNSETITYNLEVLESTKYTVTYQVKTRDAADDSSEVDYEIDSSLSSAISSNPSLQGGTSFLVVEGYDADIYARESVTKNSKTYYFRGFMTPGGNVDTLGVLDNDMYTLHIENVSSNLEYYACYSTAPNATAVYSPDTRKIQVGQEFTATATPSGGSGVYEYSYSLVPRGASTSYSEWSSDKTISFSTMTPGVYDLKWKIKSDLVNNTSSMKESEVVFVDNITVEVFDAAPEFEYTVTCDPEFLGSSGDGTQENPYLAEIGSVITITINKETGSNYYFKFGDGEWTTTENSTTIELSVPYSTTQEYTFSLKKLDHGVYSMEKTQTIYYRVISEVSIDPIQRIYNASDITGLNVTVRADDGGEGYTARASYSYTNGEDSYTDFGEEQGFDDQLKSIFGIGAALSNHTGPVYIDINIFDNSRNVGKVSTHTYSGAQTTNSKNVIYLKTSNSIDTSKYRIMSRFYDGESYSWATLQKVEREADMYRVCVPDGYDNSVQFYLMNVDKYNLSVSPTGDIDDEFVFARSTVDSDLSSHLESGNVVYITNDLGESGGSFTYSVNKFD